MLPKLQKGYLAPAAIIILAGIILLVAATIYFNGKLIKNATPSPQSTPPLIKTPTPKSTHLPATGPTSDWKTYTNSKYFYQINYPSDWKESKVNIADSDLVLLSPKNEVVYIIYNVNPQAFSLEQIHKQNWPNKNYEVLTVSGKKAIKSELGFYNIQLNNGGYLSLGYDGCYGMSCEASSSHIQKFNQILSTFKFTQ